MTEWKGKTKGSLLGYQIFLNSLKLFGLGFSYFILRFVALYFYLFSVKSRKSILNFYIQGLQFSKKKAKVLTIKNFFVSGQTIIDRYAFLMGLDKKFTYSFNNEKALVELKDKQQGGILISAHLGNWETAGNLLKNRITNKINVVMLDAEYQKIKNFFNKETGGSKYNIIAVKDDLSHIIKIKNALSNNEFVAIHGDRHMSGMKYIEVPFLGHQVKFPYGPFLIAYKFKVPITFVYAVKEGKGHYSLSATDPIIGANSPEEIAQAYVQELERMVRKHPEQWFNYFDYFQQ